MPLPNKTKAHLDFVHNIVQSQMFPTVTLDDSGLLVVDRKGMRIIPRAVDTLTLWFMISALLNAIDQSKQEIGIRYNIRYSSGLAKAIYLCLLSDVFRVKDTWLLDYFIFNGQLSAYRWNLATRAKDVAKVMNDISRIVITRYYEELKRMEVENEVTSTSPYREFNVVWGQPEPKKSNNRKRPKHTKVSRSSRSHNNKKRKRWMDKRRVS